MPLLPSLTESDGVFTSLDKLNPDLKAPLLDLHEVILRGDSPLSIAERELLAAYVSGLNACQYCHGSHKATAEELGVEVGLIAAMLENLETSGVDDKLKPICRYVQKLTLSPSKITQEDANAIYTAGWSEQALSHAVLVCATFNFMNRYVEGLGLAWSLEGFARAGKELAERGYKQT